jgi:mono/diheme cytochrome c family protein
MKPLRIVEWVFGLAFLFMAGVLWMAFFPEIPDRFQVIVEEHDYIKADQGPPMPEYGPARGKELFNTHCARCHSNALEKKSTGPALLGMSRRIPNGDWIYRWIANPMKLIEEKDAYALKIWEENGRAMMDPLPYLSREDIDAIVQWIDGYGPR